MCSDFVSGREETSILGVAIVTRAFEGREKAYTKGVNVYAQERPVELEIRDARFSKWVRNNFCDARGDSDVIGAEEVPDLRFVEK